MKKIKLLMNRWLDRSWNGVNADQVQVGTVNIFDVHNIFAIHRQKGLPIDSFYLPVAVAKRRGVIMGYTLACYEKDKINLLTNFRSGNGGILLATELESFADRIIKILFENSTEEYYKLEKYCQHLQDWLEGFAE
ncbi:hypothetical protein ACR78G_20150 [Sphingobacterium spiritivorum]|uniref:hypothetical protein n=1 Tax=Sphingobacterium spiritivorum TaxID=258 RepID=UPI003DA26688